MPDPDLQNAPPPPLDYAGYAGYAAPRSAIPRVLGILGVVYGALGLIVRVLSLSLALSVHSRGESFYTPTLHALDLAMNGTFLALGLLLIAGSIGLIARRRWGLALTTIWAAASIPLLLLFAGLFLALVTPTFLPAAGATPAQLTAQRIGYYAGLIGVTLFRLATPAVFLILLRRRTAREAVQ